MDMNALADIILGLAIIFLSANCFRLSVRIDCLMTEVAKLKRRENNRLRGREIL